MSCRDAHGEIADESLCAHLPRPAEISSCFSPCGEWKVGNWSPVSINCNNFLMCVFRLLAKSLFRNREFFFFFFFASVIEIASLEKAKYMFVLVESKYK